MHILYNICSTHILYYKSYIVYSKQYIKLAFSNLKYVYFSYHSETLISSAFLTIMILIDN